MSDLVFKNKNSMLSINEEDDGICFLLSEEGIYEPGVFEQTEICLNKRQVVKLYGYLRSCLADNCEPEDDCDD